MIRLLLGNVKYESAGFIDWIDTTCGSIELKDATVTLGIRTDQDLFAENSDMGSLNIGKNAWLKNCRVDGKVLIGEERCGQLKAEETLFEGPIEVDGNIIAENCIFRSPIETRYSHIICLTATDTQSIEVYSTGIGINNRPMVKLSCDTLVDGDIWFESDNGLVIVDETSYVNGSVIGGTVLSE